MIDRTQAPEVHPFGNLVMPDEQVEKLSNGIIFHRFSGGDQPVCNLTLHLTGGMLEMGEAECKLLLAMLTEGTATSTAEDIAEAIDFNGARFATQPQNHFCVVDMAVLTSRLDDVLPVLRDIIVNPVFPEERLEVARLKLKNSLLTMRHTPSAMASMGLIPLISGPENPLGKMLEDNDIDAVSSASLQSCHRRLLNPGRTNAYLSGLLDDDTVASVRTLLESLPALGLGYDFNYYPETPQPAGSMVSTDMPSTLQSAIACGIPAVGRSHPDYIPLRYTVMALGGYFGSRLMSNIREEKGLTYGINAGLLGGLDGAHVYIGTLTDRSNTELVIEEIRKELADMAVNPPQGEELERFRTYAMTCLAELLDNPQSVMQYYGSRNLVGTPDNYFAEQLNVLKSLTPEVMSRISEKYLSPDSMRISLA